VGGWCILCSHSKNGPITPSQGKKANSPHLPCLRRDISTYLSISLSIYLSIYPWPCNPCGPWPLFQFLNLYTLS
jgi:hypothetical protein